jgi:hypothetical protein
MSESVGPDPTWLAASFAPNGTSNPLTASNAGPPSLRAFTTTYAATGLFTVTLPAGFSVVGTPSIQVTVQALIADYFEVMVGAYVPATRSFTIQAKRAASGYAPPAAATTRIHFTVFFNNSTGG